jgi:tRNA modification GTPase
VAVIHVQNSPDTAETVLRPFVRNDSRSASLAECDRILYGSWNGEDVVLVRLAPDSWEIHCHGGFAAVSSILNDLQSSGVAITQPSDARVVALSDLPESILTDQNIIDASISEALIRCRTRLATDRILRQTDGRLVVLRSHLRSRNPAIRGAAESLVSEWKFYADHLTQPFRIAFLGAPNVGKSSLLNALAGRQRSIVSAIPGTTRDVVEAEIIVDGWIIRLSDTAGLRAVPDSALEVEGIARARSLPDQIDLLCCVTDREDGRCDPELSSLANSFPGPVLLVRNKSDLRMHRAATISPGQVTVSQSSSADDPAISPMRCDQIVEVSAITGHGIPELATQMLQLLIPRHPESDTPLPVGGCVDDLL